MDIDTSELYGRMEAFKRYGQEEDKIAMQGLLNEFIRERAAHMKQQKEQQAMAKKEAEKVLPAGVTALEDAPHVDPKGPEMVVHPTVSTPGGPGSSPGLYPGGIPSAPSLERLATPQKPKGKSVKRSGRALVMAFVDVGRKRRGSRATSTVYLPSIGRVVETRDPEQYILTKAPGNTQFMVVVRGVSPFRHKRITVKPFPSMASTLRAYYNLMDPRVSATAKALEAMQSKPEAAVDMRDVYSLLRRCFHYDPKIMGYLRDL